MRPSDPRNPPERRELESQCVHLWLTAAGSHKAAAKYLYRLSRAIQKDDDDGFRDAVAGYDAAFRKALDATEAAGKLHFEIAEKWPHL